MIITFSEIAYLLSRKYPVKEVRDAYFDAPLTSVKRYRGQVEKKQLYSIPVERVNELILHPLDNLTSSAFVAWGTGKAEDDACWEKVTQGQGKRIPIDIIYIPKVEFEEDLQEVLVDMFCMLYMWESELQAEQEMDQVDLQELLNHGRRIMGLPLSVFDKNFIVLGSTEDYFKYFPEMEGRLINRQMAQDDIKILLQNEDFLNADDQKEIFVYPSEPVKVNTLCYNIRFSGEFSARVLMVLPNFQYHQGLHKLFTCFVKYVESAYLHNMRSTSGGNQEDVLHHLFRKYLFHPKRKDYDVDFHALNLYNWYRNDEYQMIVLQMFGSKEFEKSASYLCQQLERLFEYSCTFKTDREIIWIINYTRESSVKDKENFQSNFPYLIRDFGCKAGLSDFFNDYTMLGNYRRQADIALELGNQKNPYKWYYLFNDYALDYMVAQTMTLFSAEQLSHKGLLKLYEYDREHETEFVKTLKCYIAHRFNASEAAQKLYIHRTTFIRRMERIESLISLDLDNSDDLLHILLSYRMFEGKEKSKE